MRKTNFKSLLIWQRGMEIVDAVYKFCEELPSSEKYNLISQSIRCACSIPSNIAEGSGKRSSREFARYLEIALGSAYELETHLLICQRRGYGNAALLSKIIAEIAEEQKMIYRYQEKLEQD